ncbi:hypothetical protein AB0J90_18295 [Micromonospora sp. NPDC049523]|uniref:hypothetical protein n=1 Tax=Micromonospora sp. NPDC049523 TaxID=3155921 RepID=UPI003442283B
MRDPAAAVTGTVWTLPQEAAVQVSLPELLAERITAKARAQHWYDQADAELHRRQRADRLGLVDVADVARLLGAPAAAFLGYAIGHHPRAMADADPELADAVLGWWDGDRADPAAAGRQREVLVDRHHQEWTRQARSLLAAVDQHGDQPRLCAAADRIQRGELLTRTEVDLLALPPGRSREQIQQTALAGYQTDRDAAAAAAYDALPCAGPPPHDGRRAGRRPRRRPAAGVRDAEQAGEELLVTPVRAPAWPAAVEGGAPGCRAGGAGLPPVPSN